MKINVCCCYGTNVPNESNSHLTGFLRFRPSLYDVLYIKNHPYEIINDNVGQRFTEFKKIYPLTDINYQGK